jgi:hypothetical protein
MLRKIWAVGVLAAAGMLLAAASARAADNVMLLKMGSKTEAPATTLAWDGKDADTVDAAYRYGGYRYHGGGFHYHGGGYGYYHGGYRYHSFYRPYYYGYYPRYYYPRYYTPGIYFSLGIYRPYYYYAPPVYYYSYPIYPIGASVTTMPYAITLNLGRSAPTLQTDPAAPPLPPVPAEGTYPYDGGPANPVPMPRAEPAPTSAPATVPLEGRAVSLPLKPAKPTYPAYGEETTRPTSSARDRVVKGEPNKKPTR